MAENCGKGFDAGAYWASRVGSDADLAVVGHRAMGAAYNAEIYARRIDALGTMIVRHVDKPATELRVLDIGCGSGFYTAFWQSSGVTDYVGVDISTRTIERLAGTFPDYRFHTADVTADLPEAVLAQAPYDVVTLFDVLYHIVDEARAGAAIRNIGSLVADDGRLLVMDQLGRRNYQLSKHVIYRERNAYLAAFTAQGMAFLDSESLFHFLVPPITGVRAVDWLIGAMFRLFGLLMRSNDKLARRAAAWLRALDKRLRARGVSVPNSELLIFGRKGATDE